MGNSSSKPNQATSRQGQRGRATANRDAPNRARAPQAPAAKSEPVKKQLELNKDEIEVLKYLTKKNQIKLVDLKSVTDGSFITPYFTIGDPEIAKLYEQHANYLVKNGYIEEAERYCFKAYEYEPYNEEFWDNFKKNLILIMADNQSNKSKLYKKVLKRHCSIVDATSYAFSAIKQGNFDTALKYFSKIPTESKILEHDMYVNQAHCLYKKGDSTQALECYDKALELNNDNPQIYLFRANLAEELGMLDKAVQSYEYIIANEPNSATGYIGKSRVLDAKGEFDEALKSYSTVLQLEPDRKEAIINIGKILLKKDKLEEALEYQKRALSISSDDIATQQLSVEILLKQEKLDEALEILLQINQQQTTVLNYIKIGEIYNFKEKYNEAFENFEKAIELDSQKAITHAKKAFALQQLECNELALECYDKALEIDSNNAFALVNKADLLAKMGKIEESKNCTKKAENYVKLNRFGDGIQEKDKELIKSKLEELQNISQQQSVSPKTSVITGSISTEITLAPKVVLKFQDTARRENFEEIKQLARQGKSLNSVDKSNESVLHKLIKSDIEAQRALSKLLAEDDFEFDLNIQNKEGKTVLNYALEGKNTELIKNLLLLEADPNIEDNEGKTLLFQAALNRDIYNYMVLKENAENIDWGNPVNQEAEKIIKVLQEEEQDEYDAPDQDLDEVELNFDNADAGSSVLTYNNMNYKRFLDLFNRGKYHKIIEKAKVLEKIEDNPDLLLIKTESYLAMGRYEEAEIQSDYMINNYEEEKYVLSAKLLKGYSLTRQKQYESAKEYFDELGKKSSQLDSDIKQKARGAYIKCLYYNGEKEQAKIYIDKLKQDELDIELLNIRGNIAKEEGNPEEALEYYDKALKKKGWENHPVSLTNKGLMLLSLDRKQEAMKYLSQADEILNLGYNDNMLRQINLEVLQNSIKESLNKLGPGLLSEEKDINEGTRDIENEKGKTAKDPSSGGSSDNLENKLFNYVSELSLRMAKVEKGQHENVSKSEIYEYMQNYATNEEMREELGKKADKDKTQEELDKKASREEISRELEKKVDRSEVSYAIAKNEEWEEVKTELNDIYGYEALKQYYLTFIHIFRSYLTAADVLASGKIKQKETEFSSLKEIVPLPVAKEIVGTLGGLLDKGLSYREKFKRDKLLDLAKNIDTQEMIYIVARKSALTKQEEIKNASDKTKELEGWFASLKNLVSETTKAGKLANSCKTEAQKLAYTDATKVITHLEVGKLNEEGNIIDQLINYTITKEVSNVEKVDKGEMTSEGISTGLEMGYKVAEEGKEEMSKCTVMAVPYITYYNPKLNEAWQTGNTSLMFEALNEQQAQPQCDYGTRNVNEGISESITMLGENNGDEGDNLG